MVALRFLLACLALGAIGHFGSEALFWTAPRPDMSLPGLLLTVLIYALAASVGLAAVLASGCGGFAGLFLGGALMGFAVEGAVVSTMYDAVPLQLVWTPLAWHALLTAGLVLGLTRRLAAQGLGRQLAGLALLGVGFGVWGGYWAVERPDLMAAGLGPTLAYLGGAGALAVLGQLALDRLLPLARPPRRVLLAGPLAVAALWLLGSVLAPSPVRLAGPLMAGATVWALFRLAPAHPPGPPRPVPPLRHAPLLVLPAVAALVAVGLWRSVGPVASNWPVAIASGAVALGLWLRYLWRSARSASARSSAPS
jgi:hypothetical protein